MFGVFYLGRAPHEPLSRCLWGAQMQTPQKTLCPKRGHGGTRQGGRGQ